jgi:twitching motility protein PilJ
MSLLTKMKGLAPKRGAVTEGADAGDQVLMLDDVDLHLPSSDGEGIVSNMNTATPTPSQNQAPSFESPSTMMIGNGDSSIITEAAPSEIAEFSETRIVGADGDLSALGGTGLPIIGTRSVAEQQRVLIVLLLLGFLTILFVTLASLNAGNKGSAQVAATGQALMQSQRLAKSVSQALVGSPGAFPEVRESFEVLAKNVRELKTGEGVLAAAPSAVQPLIDPLLPLVERAEKNANTVIAQQKILTQVGQALRAIGRQSSELLETAETISSLHLQQNASAEALSAAGQLVMLTQRIGKSANEFLTVEGVSPEAVFLLGKDLNSFREIAQGLLNGNQEMRLSGTKDAQTRERLTTLLKQYEDTRTQAGAILGNLQGLVSAREAQSIIVTDSEPLRKGLEAVQNGLSNETGFGLINLAGLLLASAVCA